MTDVHADDDIGDRDQPELESPSGDDSVRRTLAHGLDDLEDALGAIRKEIDGGDLPSAAVDLSTTEAVANLLRSLARARRAAIIDDAQTAPERFAELSQLGRRLQVILELVEAFDEDTHETVEDMRARGATWDDVARTVGISRQMAHYHYSRRGRDGSGR